MNFIYIYYGHILVLQANNLTKQFIPIVSGHNGHESIDFNQVMVMGEPILHVRLDNLHCIYKIAVDTIKKIDCDNIVSLDLSITFRVTWLIIYCIIESGIYVVKYTWHLIYISVFDDIWHLSTGFCNKQSELEIILISQGLHNIYS